MKIKKMKGGDWEDYFNFSNILGIIGLIIIFVAIIIALLTKNTHISAILIGIAFLIMLISGIISIIFR